MATKRIEIMNDLTIYDSNSVIVSYTRTEMVSGAVISGGTDYNTLSFSSSLSANYPLLGDPAEVYTYVSGISGRSDLFWVQVANNKYDGTDRGVSWSTSTSGNLYNIGNIPTIDCSYISGATFDVSGSAAVEIGIDYNAEPAVVAAGISPSGTGFGCNLVVKWNLDGISGTTAYQSNYTNLPFNAGKYEKTAITNHYRLGHDLYVIGSAVVADTLPRYTITDSISGQLAIINNPGTVTIADETLSTTYGLSACLDWIDSDLVSLTHTTTGIGTALDLVSFPGSYQNTLTLATYDNVDMTGAPMSSCDYSLYWDDYYGVWSSVLYYDYAGSVPIYIFARCSIADTTEYPYGTQVNHNTPWFYLGYKSTI